MSIKNVKQKEEKSKEEKGKEEKSKEDIKEEKDKSKNEDDSLVDEYPKDKINKPNELKNFDAVTHFKQNIIHFYSLLPNLIHIQKVTLIQHFT